MFDSREHDGESVDDLRKAVAQASRALAHAGLVVGTAGNVSARAGDQIAITPTGCRLAAVTAGEIAVVDLDGILLAGPLVATSELPLHLAVYRNSDAGAVVHTHPPMATAIACVLDELPCFHYALLILGGAIRVAPHATFGTDELAANVVAALAGRRAALMGAHGAITYGDDLTAAVDGTELLEWACGVYVHASACGKPRVLPAREQAAVLRALAGYGTAQGSHSAAR